MTVPVGGEMIRTRKYLLKEAEYAIPTKTFQIGLLGDVRAMAIAGEKYKIVGYSGDRWDTAICYPGCSLRCSILDGNASSCFG